MTRAAKQLVFDDILIYTGGDRRGPIVRKAYLKWRQSQTPPLPERCDELGCPFHTAPLVWNGKPFRMILDHVDGVNTNNFPTNLRLLCPNCDSQNSHTRGGANKNRVRKSAGGYSIRRADGLRDYFLPAQPIRMVLSTELVIVAKEDEV
jgi:hypothetical protein